MLMRFKGSAIHNLVVTSARSEVIPGEKAEGVVIPKSIVTRSDIYPGEEIIITKIGSGSWQNRIRTFAIEGVEGNLEVRGSVARFLGVGDVMCIIAEQYLEAQEYSQLKDGSLPIVDVGYDPKTNVDNNCAYRIDIQFIGNTVRNVDENSGYFQDCVFRRRRLCRVFASSVITGLVVNRTHPDCLQGSAELPSSILNRAEISQYKSVSVYNATIGGAADTYAVGMPDGVVMTTGAMASFASIGQQVNVVSYVMSRDPVVPTWVTTRDNCLV